MVRNSFKFKRPTWHRVPAVRSGDRLTFGERAADHLKRWFGTWTILGIIFGIIIFWLLFINDPGALHLNLLLSCMAAVQGIILQIAANRSDTTASELATHSYDNGQKLLQLAEASATTIERLSQELEKGIQTQAVMLQELRKIRGEPDGE
jgi:uncharacterized membrane protein